VADDEDGDADEYVVSAHLKFFWQRCGLTLHHSDPRHRILDEPVERSYSTLSELARCIKEEFNLTTNQKPFGLSSLGGYAW